MSVNLDKINIKYDVHKGHMRFVLVDDNVKYEYEWHQENLHISKMLNLYSYCDEAIKEVVVEIAVAYKEDIEKYYQAQAKKHIEQGLAKLENYFSTIATSENDHEPLWKKD